MVSRLWMDGGWQSWRDGGCIFFSGALMGRLFGEGAGENCRTLKKSAQVDEENDRSKSYLRILTCSDDHITDEQS